MIGPNEIAQAEDWFSTRGWSPFAFQREVWSAYLRGESGLIHAATGTGKTLAAWWGPLLEWKAEQLRDAAVQASGGPPRPRVRRKSARSSAPALRVLWITPLRALAADTLEALSMPVQDLGIPWTLESRTGDTTAAMRARQSRRLPTALVTTPESLCLLLTHDNAPEIFGDLRAVIVDEWHELMGTKRGVQVELALARIRQLRPQTRIWGLSATIGNLTQARDTLLGNYGAETGRVIRGVEPKEIVVDALVPDVIDRFPWAGHLGTQLLPKVIAAIEEGQSAIVFTNTRSQTEIWYQAILAERPDWAGSIALHHGSLDRKKREWVEDQL
ncbi:MAG TPA: DEAD/DEAH box helicase, partial [Longimicrobiales bacterium]|nr:DEAD/DEAH box helicase [Longimicrobiales bacterium]